MSNNKYICIHGHFYQPPRENPWLEDIELQDSAYPFHDWNERISEECYKANAASRILDKKGYIIKIANNYNKISFNFGPTLFAWMKRHQPEVYQSIVEADRLSQERFSGHGSAIAQAYNHMIMPLANRQDKYTQVLWGIRDFENHFARKPEGMWLPETAVDYETLEVLAEFNIKFTILAPHQAARIKKMEKDATWQEIKENTINYRLPYLCTLPSGKTISIFFYSGSLAHEVSFGNLLLNGENFARQLMAGFSKDSGRAELIHIATDGETFGHHHRFGDMALSYCLDHIEKNNLARITNYGEYLELNPPDCEVQIVENTSWSCPHGVERWRNNCGCKAGGHPDWQQNWRKPLREAMDWLRDKSIETFERGASAYFKDIWQVRNEYIAVVLNRSTESIGEFMENFALHHLSEEEVIRALKYLEMQRNAMLIYTSCGWFFDDISRIETIQNMRYAARCMQLINELDAIDLEEEYIKRLEDAPSNVHLYKNGAGVYQIKVKPVTLDLLRVGAHYAISALFNGKEKNVYSYQISEDEIERIENGQLKMAIGYTSVCSEVTLEKEKICFAVLHLGGHNVNGGVKRFENEETYQKMVKEITASFKEANVIEMVILMDKHFGTNSYSLWYMFKDEQRRVIEKILEPPLAEIDRNFARIYIDNQNIISFLRQSNIPVPRSLSLITEQVINQELKKIFSQESIDLEKLNGLLQEVERWSIDIDQTAFQFKVVEWINGVMEEVRKKPFQVKSLLEITGVLKKMKDFEIELNLWEAQNTFFDIKQEISPSLKKNMALKEEDREIWWKPIKELGEMLKIDLP
jgi:alpha-amylase/alpha-mannosidase (GH57 family)